jgi:hypothetical protein
MRSENYLRGRKRARNRVETSRRRLTRGIGFSSSLHANVQKLEVKYMHTMYELLA